MICANVFFFFLTNRLAELQKWHKLSRSLIKDNLSNPPNNAKPVELQISWSVTCPLSWLAFSWSFLIAPCCSCIWCVPLVLLCAALKAQSPPSEPPPKVLFLSRPFWGYAFRSIMSKQPVTTAWIHWDRPKSTLSFHIMVLQHSKGEKIP